MESQVRGAAEPRRAGRLRRDELAPALQARLPGTRIDVDAAAMAATVHTAAAALRGHVERTALARHELTWTAWLTLWAVWLRDDQDAGQVASAVGISRGTLTGISRNLEGRGLLVRRVHPTDRRRVLFALSDTGLELVQDHVASVNAAESEALGGLGEAEAERLSSALDTVIATLAHLPSCR